MRLLLTRPEPAATATRARLEAAGHEVTLAPLLTFRPVRPLPDPQGPFQAVLATSGNALRAIAGTPLAERLAGAPLLAVGERTAETARTAGFDALAAAGSGGEDLARLARDLLKADGPALLVLEARDRAVDLAGELERAGFRVARAQVYAMEKEARLPEPVLGALAAGRLDGVLLYSARTAQAFAEAWRSARVLDGAADMPALYCLSPKVAARVRALGAPVATAAAPTEDALLALLGSRPSR